MNGLGGRSETPYILPDFYITEENGQLHIIMNDYYLPKIIIDPTYQQIIQSGTLDKSDQEYIQKNYFVYFSSSRTKIREMHIIL